MHTVNEAGGSAECYQTLSSLVGSENETNELPIRESVDSLCRDGADVQ